MSKKVRLSLSVVLVFAFLSGVVSAASINGEYKGNPIVKVYVNGQEVRSEVPAHIVDGSTLLPMRAVAESLGANVKWDEKTYSVNIENKNLISNSLKSPNDIAKEFKNRNIAFVEYVSDGDEFRQLSFHYKYGIMSGESDEIFDKLFVDALLSTLQTDATSFRFVDVNGAEIIVITPYIKEFSENKITIEELLSKSLIKGFNQTPNFSDPYIPYLPYNESSEVIESKIDGDFDGFENGKLFKLMNGQIWEQIDFTFHYTYKFMPNVTIYKDGASYKMIVEGVDKVIKVRRIK